MKQFLSFLIAILLSFSSAWAEGNYASQSVLSSGRWVKIKVTKNGVYKLTASDLNKMGFSDPSKVSVNGYGGWILDEQFSDSAYHDDLPAVPVWRDGSTLYFMQEEPSNGVMKTRCLFIQIILMLQLDIIL